MADSHFFIATNSGVSQSSNEAFGPVLSNETTQYRVTSKFSATGDTAAYAAFTAQVFLQPSTETDKVNLILRPYKQPIKGLDIKYFIYRGLKKTDFIPSGNDDLVSFTQKDTASGFIKILWEQLVSFDSKASANPFKAKWIGYDPENQLPDTFIDDYFFAADAFADQDNESIKPFEFPIIPKGTHLGHFKGNFGLDVVLSDGDYKALTSNTGFQFNLAYARATESTIDIAATPTGYAEKQYREAIHHFMDPAAFWGLHVNDESTVKIKEATDSNILKGQQIYEKVISKFATKNNVYLHIQGHLGRSYNYYDSYGETIKLGDTVATITDREYKTKAWPILIYNEAQTHDNEVNTIFLQLKYDEAANPLLYGEVATMSDEAENNFLVADQLIPKISETEEVVVLDFYTNSLEINVPAFGNSSNKLNGSNYVKLLYQGSELEVADADIYLPIKMIDSLFRPLHIESRFESVSEDVISWTNSFESKLFKINTSNIVSQNKIIFDKISYQDQGSLQIQDRVIFETKLLAKLEDELSTDSITISSSENAGIIPFSKEVNNSYQLTPPYIINLDIFSNSNQTITSLSIGVANEQVKIDKFILGLDLEEFDFIKNKISEENIKNPSVFFYKDEENSQSSLKQYSIKILGETQNSELVFLDTDEVITIFSVDTQFFFTKKFSERVALKEDNILIPDFTL